MLKMIELKKLPKGIIKVDNPDHPFTYDGPDTLLSDKKGLVALFKVRDNEQKNTNKLFTRLTNSLIAYPAYTKMILLKDEKEIPDIIAKCGEMYFSRVIEFNDIKKIKLLINDKKESNKIQEIKYNQKKIYKVQAQVQLDNLKYFREHEFNKKEIFNLPNLKTKAKFFNIFTQKYISSKANIFESERHIIGLKRLIGGRNDLTELQPFFEFVINSEFKVDSAIPYFNTSNERKVLNLNQIPRLKFDPLKPTRIASLFGWYITNSNDFQQIKDRIK